MNPARLFLVCFLGASCAYSATLYVNPVDGNDTNTGASPKSAWKTFEKLNARKLAPGDKVLVAPGMHEKSLHPKARGTVKAPVVIEFLPGVHEFAAENALRRPLFVSNSCDAPTAPKPIAILIENCAHLRLQGAGVEGDKKTLLLMGGRMVEAANLQSEDVSYRRLVFDLKRPTVSEFRVAEVTGDTAVIQIAEGSNYEINNGKFRWTGDLGSGNVMVQQAIPAEGRCWRRGFGWDPFTPATAEEIAPGKVRLVCQSGSKAYGMAPGHQYHFRHILRDSVGVFNERGKDILFEDCDVYALTNMGFVSQFTENLTFRRVRVAPPKETIRTCPAWGDIFQFSNCKGRVVIEGCVESGMQDDAVNCHGTHLRIVGKPAEKQLTLRYMQPQTYGFAPYIAGDEIAVIDSRKLREIPNNPRRKVRECVQADKDGREWTVTLDGPAPAFNNDDVTDNITWHPDLLIRNCSVNMDPVRGYLITTRGKVIIEGNTIQSAMPGILVEDDARGWYESTCVRDLTIRKNRFLNCGIEINPQTSGSTDPVHENIRIIDNDFKGGTISAKGVKNLIVTGNGFSANPQSAIHTQHCEDVKVEGNTKR